MEKTASIAKSLPLTVGAVFGFSLASYMFTGIFTESAIGRPSSTSVIGLLFAPIYSLVFAGVGALLGLVIRPFMLRRGESDIINISKLSRYQLLVIIVASVAAGTVAAMRVVAYEKHDTPRILSNSANLIVETHSEGSIPSVARKPALVWEFGNKNIIVTEWLGNRITFNVADSFIMNLKNNSASLASYNFSGYTYVTEISTLPMASQIDEQYLVVLVKLRATSFRSMILVYDDNFNIVYESLLQRCGRTQYIGTAEGIKGEVLVINLCKPFTIDFNI